MTEREHMVVEAFLRAYRDGDWTYTYIVLALEDDERFGWMSDEAKQAVYKGIEDIDHGNTN